jgi:hypothetical protein
MKRSKFITKVLKDFSNTVFTTKEQVEVALELFEKLGMLPPPKEIECVTDHLIYCYYKKVDEKKVDGGWILDRDNSQLWEPEDEEK